MDEAARSHYATVERAWDSARPVHADATPEEFGRIADEIRRRLAPGGRRLLDVGCGSGELIALLAEDGPEDGRDCYGFDFAQAKLDRAAARNPGKVWKQGFLAPFAGAPYDRIVSYSVVQYCRPQDFPTLLANTVAALAVGGQAIHFAVPIFELYEFANGVYFHAGSEAELDAWRRRLVVSAMDGTPVRDDGTFFHSREKARALVTEAGHRFAAYPSRSRYRLDLEIVRMR